MSPAHRASAVTHSRREPWALPAEGPVPGVCRSPGAAGQGTWLTDTGPSAQRGAGGAGGKGQRPGGVSRVGWRRRDPWGSAHPRSHAPMLSSQPPGPRAFYTHVSLRLLDLGAPLGPHCPGHTQRPRSPRTAHSAFSFLAGASHLPFTGRHLQATPQLAWDLGRHRPCDRCPALSVFRKLAGTAIPCPVPRPVRPGPLAPTRAAGSPGPLPGWPRGPKGLARRGVVLTRVHSRAAGGRQVAAPGPERPGAPSQPHLHWPPGSPSPPRRQSGLLTQPGHSGRGDRGVWSDAARRAPPGLFGSDPPSQEQTVAVALFELPFSTRKPSIQLGKADAR